MGHPGLIVMDLFKVYAWRLVQQVDIEKFMKNSWLEKIFDFSNNFVSKNSVQIQNFRSWLYRVENLIDCGVSWKKQNSKRALTKWYRALLSGMTDCTYLSDYNIILLANFNL